MFRKSSIKMYEEAKALGYYRKRVTDVKSLDASVFRTDYLRNKFSMFEYVQRLKEIYNSRGDIEKKIENYIGIENSLKKNLEEVSELDKILFYFSIGFFITRVFKKEDIKAHYNVYNYGVFENEDIVAIYFEIEVDEHDINFLEYKDYLFKIFNVTEDNVMIRKINNIFELILLKKDMVSLSFSDALRNTDFSYLEEEGYIFPLLLGKDDNCKNIYLDLEHNSSIVLLGNSGSGKSTMLNNLLLNILCLYEETEANLVILDSNENEVNKSFSYSPHVIGYHTNVLDFLSVLRELNEEVLRRRDILSAMELYKWSELRDYLIVEDETELLNLFPWTILIIEDLTNVLVNLSDINEDLMNDFLTLLNFIVDEGARVGIKIVATYSNNAVGTINDSIMKFIEVFDTKILLKTKGKYIENYIDLRYIDAPTLLGEFILKDKDNIYPTKGRSFYLGTFDSDKINYLVKILSIDIMKSFKSDDTGINDLLKFTRNRDTYISESVLNDPSIFDIKKDTRVLDIAKDLKLGKFDVSKYRKHSK